MHLHNIEIRNVRGLKSLDWSLRNRPKKAGWHVVIGDNGSGKSSFLRAIALTLLGPDEFAALRQNPNDWLSQGQTQGGTKIWYSFDRRHDRLSGGGQPIKKFLPGAGVSFQRTTEGVQLRKVRFTLKTARTVWGTGTGWFSAGYGPFRRFTGGNKDLEKIFYSNPKLGRHLSIFGEDVALSEALEWMQTLRFKQLEKRPEGDLLECIKKFINQPDFLPHGVKLSDVTSEGVMFEDADGASLPVAALSDGFRSLLSMTFELIRQLALEFGPEEVFDIDDATTISLPALVLIDEIDAHLHPTWQRRVGLWFRKHFPNIQFIVTTHSPLVCQAADVGTVFRLPTPGTGEPGAMLEGDELGRLLYGNVLDAYSTGVFGEDVGRSDVGKTKLTRLAELNAKEAIKGLTASERQEQVQLQRQMPTAAGAVSNGSV